METFVETFQSLIDFVTFSPETMGEAITIYVVAIVLGGFIAHFLGMIFNLEGNTIQVGYFITIIGTLLILSIGTMGLSFLAERFEEVSQKQKMIGVISAVSLLIVVPMIKMLWRTKMISALLIWVCTAGAMCGAALGTQAVFDGIRAGANVAENAAERSRTQEKMINQE